MNRFYNEAIKQASIGKSNDRPLTSKREPEKPSLTSTFDYALYNNFINSKKPPAKEIANTSTTSKNFNQQQPSKEELELARSSLRLLKSKMTSNTSRFMEEDNEERSNYFEKESNQKFDASLNQSYRKVTVPSFDEGEIDRKTKELAAAINKGYTPTNQTLNQNRQHTTQNPMKNSDAYQNQADDRPAYTKTYSRPNTEQVSYRATDELDRTYTGSVSSKSKINDSRVSKEFNRGVQEENRYPPNQQPNLQRNEGRVLQSAENTRDQYQRNMGPDQLNMNKGKANNYDDIPVGGGRPQQNSKQNSNYMESERIKKNPQQAASDSRGTDRGFEEQYSAQPSLNSRRNNNMDDRNIKSNNSTYDERPIGGGRNQAFDNKNKGESTNYSEYPAYSNKANTVQAKPSNSSLRAPNNDERQLKGLTNNNSQLKMANNFDERPATSTNPKQNSYGNDERPVGTGRNNMKRGAPALQEYDNNNEDDDGDLVECPQGCGRSFNQNAIEKHSKICVKVFQKKRKVFDMTQKRAVDEDAIGGGGFGSYNPPKKNSKPNQKKQGTSKSQEETNKNDKWKTQSEAFRAIIKQCKGGNISAQEQAKLKEAIKLQQDELILCKYCGRRFNDKAAQKHLPFCEQKYKTDKMKQGGKKPMPNRR